MPDKKLIAEMTKLANKFTRRDFTIPTLPKEYPLFSRIISDELRKITDIPELRDNKALFILSDYGGEHSSAAFTTYSFLICGYDKVGGFFDLMANLRSAHMMSREYAYKDLKYGPTARSLYDYLEYANSFVPGLLVNIAIDKNISTVFGMDAKEAQDQLSGLLSEKDLGEWKGHVVEKLLRICHPIALFLSILSVPGQKILWMSDHDTINENGKKRNFDHTQKTFGHVLRMYTQNDYDLLSFAKPFKNDFKTKDLLSLTDLSAGAYQELLTAKFENSNAEASEAKKVVIKWLGREGVSLRKWNFYIRSKNQKTWDYGTVRIDDNDPSVTVIPLS